MGLKWNLRFYKKAVKDLELLKQSGLAGKVKQLVQVLEIDPFQKPPSYEKLQGDLAGMYSRRINIQHRIVYSVDEETHTVMVYRMWTHYE